MKLKDKVTGRFTTHDITERFWEKVDRRNTNECWPWKAFTPKAGYGRLRFGNKAKQATHVSWFIHKGYWPTKFMCHKCDNPTCVNPHHLFEGTLQDNVADMMSKGRKPSGDKVSGALLKNDQVKAIREQYNGEYGCIAALARSYGVSHSLISKIIHNKNWKQI